MTEVLGQLSQSECRRRTVWRMRTAAFKVGSWAWEPGLSHPRDLPAAPNLSAFLGSYCHVHSTAVHWYQVLCFSTSSRWGHTRVGERGHLGVPLLKTIAPLLISGFVQKGSHTQYLVHIRVCGSWRRSGYCTVLHFSFPLKFYSLCEVSLKLSRIYAVLMPLTVCVWVWEGGRGVIPEEGKRQIHNK